MERCASNLSFTLNRNEKSSGGAFVSAAEIDYMRGPYPAGNCREALSVYASAFSRAGSRFFCIQKGLANLERWGGGWIRGTAPEACVQDEEHPHLYKEKLMERPEKSGGPAAAGRILSSGRGGMSMLQIKNLTITHKKDLRELIRGLSFTLNAGDKIAVIGEEGNGKSTLLKLIFDERLTEGYAEYTG